MSATKSVVTVSSLAFALMFGGGVFLFMNLGDIAKNVTERIASETLGVRVSIGAMDVNLPDKSITVTNTKVGNPPGYSKANAVEIERIYMKAQALSETLLRFNDVAVSGSEVYLEVKSDRTNLTDIKKTVDEKAAKGDRAAEQIKVIIENMKIDKMKVNPSVLLLSETDLEPITIPDIVLRGIGVKENGVLASEAIGQVWDDVMRRVQRHANQAGFYQGLDPAAIEELGVGQIDNFKGQLKDDIDELGKSLGGLFGD